MTDVEMMDESELPSAAECQQRCEMFAAITGTDTALAMMFLQDLAWNVESAVNAFFDEMKSADSPMRSVVSTGNPVAAGMGDRYTLSFPETSAERLRIRVLSWNLDGLDKKGLSARTNFAIDRMRQILPHVILLQEVVLDSEEIFRNELRRDYEFICDKNRSDYYCLILLHKKHCVVEDFSCDDFENSVMGRGLITVKAHIKDVPCVVMTSHFESTRDFSSARKVQLQRAWDQMIKTDDRNVIFGGDLNLRDSEVEQLNGVPSGIEDLWESCGKRSEARYTWDPKRNSNCGMQFAGPGCRFDRIYLKRRHSGKQLKPIYFELSGIEKLPRSSNRFISDHWAILSHFDII